MNSNEIQIHDQPNTIDKENENNTDTVEQVRINKIYIFFFFFFFTLYKYIISLFINSEKQLFIIY